MGQSTVVSVQTVRCRKENNYENCSNYHVLLRRSYVVLETLVSQMFEFLTKKQMQKKMIRDNTSGSVCDNENTNKICIIVSKKNLWNVVIDSILDQYMTCIHQYITCI